MTNCLRTVDKPAADMGESGMATGGEVEFVISSRHQQCYDCGSSIEAGEPAGRYRDIVLCDVCAEHKEAEALA